MGIGVGVHAAGDGARLYDGHCHPFLRLRDGTHPLAVGPGNPGLLPRPGRSDRQRRWVPGAGPGRQVDLKTARAASADSEVRPGPRPLTLRPHQAKTTQARPEAEKQGRKHYPHPPCRIGAGGQPIQLAIADGHIGQFWACPYRLSRRGFGPVLGARSGTASRLGRPMGRGTDPGSTQYLISYAFRSASAAWLS